MAKPYFEQLEALVQQCNLTKEYSGKLEVKHFFSGAALYSDGVICSSLSPLGLSFKLTGGEVEKLIKSGKAVPLKYFEKGHVKKGYAMFASPNLKQIKRWRGYFLKALVLSEKSGA